MKLRSNRVLKGGKHKISLDIKKPRFSNQRRLSLRSNKEYSGGKGAGEAEIGLYEDGYEIIDLDVEGAVNAHDKGLFLGSEVLDPVKDLGAGEDVEEEEGNESMSMHLSEADVGFKGFEVFADHAVVVDGDGGKEALLHENEDANLCGKSNGVKEKVKGRKKKFAGKKKTEKIDVFGVNGDGGKETALDDDDRENGNLSGKCDEMKEKVKGRKKKNVGTKKTEKIDVSGVNGDGFKETPLDDLENVNVLRTCDGMKEETKGAKEKKNVGKKKSEKIDVEFGVNGDVDGDKEISLDDHEDVDISGESTEMKEKVDGKKKKNTGTKKTEKIDDVVGVNGDDDERTRMPLKQKMERKRKNVKASGSEGNVKAKKKKVEKDGAVVVEGKFRGWGDDGFRTVICGLRNIDGTPKEILESLGASHRVVEEGENTRPRKLKKRERPCKPEGEVKPSPLKVVTEGENKGSIKKVKKRESPSKPEGEIKDKPSNEVPRKKRKHPGRPLKVFPVKVDGDGNGSGNVFKKFKRVGRPRETAGSEITGQSLRRNELKQLVREKISSLLTKCGWKVDSVQRPGKSHRDPVFTEPHGRRSHWTTTDAYAKLKWRIENGVADDTERSGFTPIPEEELSTLFRRSLKIRKKHEKKTLPKVEKKMLPKVEKKTLPKVKKGKIVTEKKKADSKKSEDETKKKMLFKPRVVIDGSENGPKEDNDGVLVIKKRNLLSWMVDLGVILPGTKVQYRKTRRQKQSSEGVITDEGICCSCCNKIMGITEFVGHCGGKLVQVFDSLYLESGTCVRKCLMDSWRKEEELNAIKFNFVDVQGDDPNDDTCNICGDGGDLVCCDSCPSTFHQSCLDIQNFPSGHWDCIHCTCKFCGAASVSTPQLEDSCAPVTSQMVSCCLCDDKFHQLCVQEVEDANQDSNKLPFCGRKCQELFERLQTYIGVKHELEDGFSWTLLQRSEIDQDLNVHDTELNVEQNSKLAVAFSVMDECFVPIIDDRSGTNVIRDVVYNCGSNFKRLNYSGFVTAVLEKDDEFITTASIRIHGNRLAEMPFIGTRHVYRRQGMCRRLLDVIESTLYSLGVEELVIPAIPALLQTWTTAFGFMPLDEPEKQAMKSMSVMVFPGIDMLKKPISAAGVGRDVTVQERKKETGLSMDGCSDPKPNDENTPQFETTSSNATDYKQTSADVRENVFDFKETENETVLTDCFSCRDLENDKSTFNSVCDLNLPANSVLPCDTDGQTSADSESSELKVDAENGGVHGGKVKPSPLTSTTFLKNSFDLNLHPTALETDAHIVSDEPRAGIKPLELSDLRTDVDPSADRQPLPIA